MSLANATLPVDALRKKLMTLTRRGYRVDLAKKSGVNTATIHRIAFGPQKCVTYENWKALHEGDPENIPSPDAILDELGSRFELDEDEQLIVNVFRRLDIDTKNGLLRHINRLLLVQMDKDDEEKKKNKAGR